MQAHSSSSNSVISSVDSSNYDSGAYSRTSSPEMGKKASARHRYFNGIVGHLQPCSIAFMHA